MGFEPVTSGVEGNAETAELQLCRFDSSPLHPNFRLRCWLSSDVVMNRWPQPWHEIRTPVWTRTCDSRDPFWRNDLSQTCTTIRNLLQLQNMVSIPLGFMFLRGGWGLHSTEVAYLLLSQQPRIQFLVLPIIFLLMLPRFIDGTALNSGQTLDNVNRMHSG